MTEYGMNDEELAAFLDLPEANGAAPHTPIGTTYIWVNRWEEFQTYSLKRGKPWAPPWIKLYPQILDEPAFVTLPAQTRSVLVGIWALFARSRGTLTKDTRNLSRQLSQRVTERQLQRLSDAGFIQFCSGTVREQLWNTFWNSSALEVEVEVEENRTPQTPRTSGGPHTSRKKPKSTVCPDCEVGGGLHSAECPRVQPAILEVQLPANGEVPA